MEGSINMENLDLTVIILTFNEEIHIRRCLENVQPIAKEILVIDCLSTDRTQAICKEYPKVTVVEHPWPGNQADQFNWAIDNIPIKTAWVLRLDADEYLTTELIIEIQDKLPSLDNNISAVLLPLGRVFQGKLLKHGGDSDNKIIRLFRTGTVRYEKRLMDEHLLVLKGETITFKYRFCDDSLIGIRAFVIKHNGYSDREAALLLDAEYHLTDISDKQDNSYAPEVIAKRNQKEKYAKLPLFHRAIWYFIYRYILRGGFLDGKAGFCWAFFQGLWYRMLVDAKVYEAKKISKGDKSLIMDYIQDKLMIEMK